MRNTIGLLIAISLTWSPAMANPVRTDPTVVKGNAAFAVDLFQRLRSKAGNLFLSPFSISTALTLTSTGAKGQTYEQMARVLHLPPASELRVHLAAITKETKAGAGGKHYELHSANALWGASGYPFRPEFIRDAKDLFGAELSNVDFASDPDGARRTINATVAKEIQNRIQDLIPPRVLGPDTRLVLTNAIYFKGKWAEPFHKNLTKEEPFRTADGAKPKAALMNRTAHFGYVENGDLQALELPYAGEDLSLLVLLPKNDNLAGVEQGLTAERLANITARLSTQTVNVSLPRFKVTAEFELSHVLRELGMVLAFSEHADFSGMTSSNEALMLSKVLHKAFVETNEEGTEAAAATAISVMPTSVAVNPRPIPVFRADHPFLYLIRDRRNGSILFLGRLADPTK